MRITESRLRSLIRSVISESIVINDVHQDWPEIAEDLRDDEYYEILDLIYAFEDLQIDVDDDTYEDSRCEFEDRARDWLIKKGLSSGFGGGDVVDSKVPKKKFKLKLGKAWD